MSYEVFVRASRIAIAPSTDCPHACTLALKLTDEQMRSAIVEMLGKLTIQDAAALLEAEFGELIRRA